MEAFVCGSPRKAEDPSARCARFEAQAAHLREQNELLVAELERLRVELDLTHKTTTQMQIPDQKEETLRGRWIQNGGLWPSPRMLRQGSGNDLDYETDRDMTWSELFFDLIFVVAIARLDDVLKDGDDTWSGLGNYLLLYCQYFLFWEQAAHYSNRFGTNDLPNMLFFFAITGGIAFMTVHLQGDDPCKEGFFVAAGCVSMMFVLVYMRVIASQSSGQSVKVGRNMLLQNLGMGIAYAVAACVGGCSNVAWWCQVVMIFFEVFVWCGVLPFLYSRYRWAVPTLLGGYSPFHLEHIDERRGLLVIVFLGDILDGITQCYVATPQFYLTVFFAFVSASCLKSLFFDVDDKPIDDHAIRRAIWTALLWTQQFPFLCLGIAFFGTGLNVTCHHVAGMEHDLAGMRQDLTCCGCALFLLLLSLMNCTHTRDWHKKPSDRKAIILQRVFWVQLTAQLGGACVLTVLPGHGLPDTVITGIVAAMLVLMVVLNMVDEVIILRQGRGYFGGDEPLLEPSRLGSSA